jgi:hypothetical protein
MAISVQVLGSAGTVRESGARAGAFEVPLAKVWRAAAAGVLNLDAEFEVGLVQNLGDAVYIRFNLDADSTQAGAGDAQSILLPANAEFPFGFPAGASSSDYEIDIRAAA